MSATANLAEYSEEGFDKDDQQRLLECVEELDERGVYFVLSNTGVMCELYDEAGFHVAREGRRCTRWTSRNCRRKRSPRTSAERGSSASSSGWRPSPSRSGDHNQCGNRCLLNRRAVPGDA